MQDYRPSTIFIEPDLTLHPVAQRVLAKFPNIPVCEVSDRREIKVPTNITHAKKQLFLSRSRGQGIKECQGKSCEYVCCEYHTISLVTDCHLECTYCILQDYLKNNPVITIHPNIEDILSEIHEKAQRSPDHTLRFGPGELSDSLALDHITEFSKDLIAFANEHPNVILELKTKTNNIQNVLDMEHKGNTVISWSVNPQKYIEQEEHKCSSLQQRFAAAQQCRAAKYPIAFHLDPLLHLDDWEQQYTGLIEEMASYFSANDIAWISLGSLRFTKDLRFISQARFPKSRIMTSEIYPHKDGKMRYFRPLREEMYKHLTKLIHKNLPKTPFYLCMETKAVWQRVTGVVPQNIAEVERQITSGFSI